MATSTVVSRVCRPGGVPSSVSTAAARAGVFSALSTALAVVGHHVVFDASPSWAVRTGLAMVFFTSALPGAAQPRSLTRQLALTFAAQTTGFVWLTAGAAGNVEEQGPLVLAHLAMTALLALLLHGTHSGRHGLPRLVQELRSLCAWLWRTLFPRTGVDAAVPVALDAPVRGGPVRAPPSEPLLADCVVRRGPPLAVPLAAA